MNDLHWKTDRQAAILVKHVNQKNQNCFKRNWNERNWNGTSTVMSNTNKNTKNRQLWETQKLRSQN